MTMVIYMAFSRGQRADFGFNKSIEKVGLSLSVLDYFAREEVPGGLE